MPHRDLAAVAEHDVEPRHRDDVDHHQAHDQRYIFGTGSQHHRQRQQHRCQHE
ncbi:hypothetical protein SDC9_183806 [bioreactor metagenome]|uniref:Uncharacterized protein n=1 Tax=bioreactor metagenome TaxID=1076179 RepID=A0A645HB95_9ZZZZ